MLQVLQKRGIAAPKNGVPAFRINRKSFSTLLVLRSSDQKEYSHTLNLPKTKFPNRPKASNTKKFIQELSSDLYCWQEKALPEDSLRVFHDGPPYANGDLHLGHALNKIVKDFINRHNVLMKRKVSYIPGWDCHGLPIEQKALELAAKKHGSKVDSYTIYKKRELANKLANQMSSKQLEEFRSFAIMADWDGGRVYRTLTSDHVIRQLKVFREMLQGGLISRQERPVYWSVESGTALAESELQYGDHTSTTATVKFPLAKPSPVLEQVLEQKNIKQSDVSFLIWTTTPWTLLANRAIAVGADIEYCLAKTENHGVLVVASSLADQLEGAELVATGILGKDLVGSDYSCLIRKGNETYPVLSGVHVTDGSGTGLVHTAPGHGNEDYLLGKSSLLEVYSPVDEKGRYTSNIHPFVSELCGLDARTEGQGKVLELLDKANAAVHIQKISHSVPFDWRSKTPVMVRSTPQFFADVQMIKDKAVKALDEVEFTPASGKTRLNAFTISRSEWCISRQRAWGVPIPVVYEKETGKPLMDIEVVDSIINQISVIAAEYEAKHGEPLNQWFKPEEDISRWLPEGYDGTKYRKGTDTMDVWFDSGTSWTMLEKRPNNKFLADYYLEGSDQHRGWFQSSLLTKIAVDKDIAEPSAPFARVITHGFLLDEHGKKMSKSIGNTVLPHELINGSDKTQAIGVDGMRLWIAQSDYTSDVSLSPFIISQVGALLKKIRLTYKFILGNISVGEYNGEAVPYQKLSAVDKKALHDLRKLSLEAMQGYEVFNFSRVVKALQNHMNNQLSAFYFDVVKDRLYAENVQSINRRSAQFVLSQILKTYTLIFAPITPILSQEVWQAAPAYINADIDSPFKHGWEKLPDEWENFEIDADFERLMDIKKHVNETIEIARMDKKIGSSLGCDVYLQAQSEDLQQLLIKHTADLSDFFIISNAHIGSPPSADKWSYSLEKNGLNVVVGPSHGHKCPRCWKFTSVEADSLCGRCEEVLA